jgi:hypothetical protein
LSKKIKSYNPYLLCIRIQTKKAEEKVAVDVCDAIATSEEKGDDPQKKIKMIERIKLK